MAEPHARDHPARGCCRNGRAAGGGRGQGAGGTAAGARLPLCCRRGLRQDPVNRVPSAQEHRRRRRQQPAPLRAPPQVLPALPHPPPAPPPPPQGGQEDPLQHLLLPRCAPRAHPTAFTSCDDAQPLTAHQSRSCPAVSSPTSHAPCTYRSLSTHSRHDTHTHIGTHSRHNTHTHLTRYTIGWYELRVTCLPHRSCSQRRGCPVAGR